MPHCAWHATPIPQRQYSEITRQSHPIWLRDEQERNKALLGILKLFELESTEDQESELYFSAVETKEKPLRKKLTTRAQYKPEAYDKVRPADI